MKKLIGKIEFGKGILFVLAFPEMIKNTIANAIFGHPVSDTVVSVLPYSKKVVSTTAAYHGR